MVDGEFAALHGKHAVRTHAVADRAEGRVVDRLVRGHRGLARGIIDWLSFRPSGGITGSTMKTLGIVLGLLLAGLLAYHNSLAGPFVFDDKPAILHNPTIRQLWPLSVPLAPPADGSSVTGRPVVNLSFALNYACGGEAVRGYHGVNLALHLLAGLLVFATLRRTLTLPSCAQPLRAPADAIAGVAALLWLVHPVQTESVTAIVQRTESLAGVFYLATLYASLRLATAAQGRGRWAVLGVACCALGMATKETAVTAPVLVLLYDRTFLSGSFAAALRLRGRYYLGLAATWLLLAALLLHGGGTRGVAAGLGLGVGAWDYALTQTRAVWIYLRLLCWPHPLVFDYGTAVVGSWREVWWQAPLCLVWGLGTLWALWRRPRLGFASAGFLLLLAPSSSVVPLVSQTMAEHRLYLPSALLLAAFVIALARWGGNRALGAAALAAPMLMVLTVQRNTVYQSELGLWTDTVAHAPDNPRARVNLAETLLLADRPAEALEHAQAAVLLHPRDAEALTNLGIALALTGRPIEAIDACAESVRLRPDFARGRSNYAVVLAQQHRLTEAVAQFTAALQLEKEGPDACALRLNLGKALLQAGRPAEALPYFDQVLAFTPNAVDALYVRGLALRALGRTVDAQTDFAAVLRLQPDHPGARRALGQSAGHER